MDYLQLHKDKKGELTDLYQRMKADQELITNTAYVLKDLAGKKIKNVVGMSGNRPLVFATYVEAALNRADEKVYVESDDEKLDTAKIEDIIKRMFAQANRKRREKGLVRIEPFIDQQNCRRGRSMARVLVQTIRDNEGEHLDIDITPWDTLYATYELGDKGLAWGAYEMRKSKAVIESEAWAIKEGFTISEKGAITIDIWTPEANIIYVKEEKIWEQEHNFGFTPLVLQIVPIGTMNADEDNIKYEGESYLFMIRHLIPEFNRLVSIMQTHNMRSVKGALQEATQGKAHEYEEVTSMGAITPVETPNAITPIPYTEVRQSAILLLREITKAIDDGSLSPIMLGDLPGEMSAVALLQVEQGQGQVYMPRLGSRGLLKEQIAEMIIAEMQTRSINSFQLGAKGHKKAFTIGDLNGEYGIEFSYANKSTETDYARLSIAKQYEGILDRLTILKDILKRDDPEGDLNNLLRQELRDLSPTLRLKDGLKALADLYKAGDESAGIEIDILEEELGVHIDSILKGNLPQGNIQRKEQPAVPLMVTGGGRSSAQKAADLQRTPLENIEGEQ